MHRNKVFFMILIVVVACTAVRGQDESKKPSVKLTSSVQEIGVPAVFNQACMTSFYESNPKVGRMDQPVTLKTEVVEMGPGPLKYSYQVTGGLIEGEGPSVKWNLIGVQPQAYAAVVEVKNERGTISYASTTVTISMFHCEDEWFGFNAKISCPDEVTAGEPATVLVKIERAPPDAKIKYEWSLSAGKIKSGQGSASISIDTAGIEEQFITATVQLKGIAPGFQTSYTCIVMVTRPKPKARKLDE